ncbi:MAG TPA: nucleoid occlusion factor SlmA [Ferrovaceae bacterium]|uniref:nucleoid occlusion factor SlmA n=2 Tax=Ferrovum sp. JA12 TaxID=1356299 RepID=UPI00195573F5|nr:nucleoid occlusion factor SlmA [Ferrovum sp. JA12]HQT82344.1 nucleoid occlusion factor SlmA [Ferrovaceae bacterium]HQU07348.1 nucleoid occlusion factor SlmA [Ferrovaceae bacterium]
MMSGERRNQILQALASILEQPLLAKTTTAYLAEKLNLSEAALYRHFASKAQMFEGLIEFIEETLFTRMNRIIEEQPHPLNQIESIMTLLLAFADKNPGMTRVLIGDALVHENDRLQLRVNQVHDRVEATLRQAIRLRLAEHPATQTTQPSVSANLLMCIVIGRWHQFAKTGFKRRPLDGWEEQWRQINLLL